MTSDIARQWRGRMNRRRLMKTLVRLMTIEDWADRARIVQDNPALLSPDVENFICNAIEQFQEIGNDEYVKSLSFWRDLLRRCRKIGVGPAFNALLGGSDVSSPETIQPALGCVAELEDRFTAGDDGALDALAALWVEIADEPAVQKDYPLLRAVAHSNLGNVLMRRYLTREQPSDLSGAIEAWETAIQFTPAGALHQAIFLLNLAGALHQRQDLVDIRRALALVDEAIRIDPGIDIEAASTIVSIGNTAQQVFERDGSSEALNIAIATGQHVLDNRLVGAGQRQAEVMNGLAQALHKRHNFSRDVDALIEAISWAEQAVCASQDGSETWASSQNTLAICLRTRSRETSDASSLDQAILVHQEVLDVLGDDSRLRVNHLHGLGVALGWRYNDNGDPEDLTRAVLAHEAMVASVNPTKSNFATSLNGFGNTLRARYLALGNVDDLYQAIAVHRRALAHKPPGIVGWTFLSDLAIDLRYQHAQSGAIGVLDEAIDVLREAMTDRNESVDRDLALFTLGSCLIDRYQEFGEATDGEEAIQIMEEALTRTPTNSRARPVRLANLAAALLVRYEHSADVPDNGLVDRAERLLEEAAGRSRGPKRAMYLNNLGSCITLHPGHEAPAQSVRRLVSIMEEVSELSSPEAPNGSAYRLNLGEAYLKLYEHTAESGALQRAVCTLREACVAGLDRHPNAVLIMGRTWGNQAAAEGRWAEAVEAYGYALDASDRIVGGSPVRDHKQRWLRRGEGLSAATATAYVHTGDLWGAAVALERGRAQLLTDALGWDAAEIARLAEQHPDLAEAYRSADARIREMQRLQLRSVADDQPRQSARAFDEAQRQLTAALLHIRRTPGFERFHLSNPRQEITDAARIGPIAYIVAGAETSFAIVVTERSVQLCKLPRLRLDDLLRRLPPYFDAYEDQSRNLRRWCDVLDDTTRWLWDMVMGPLLNALPNITELTLIPVGRLGLLPLHAAWISEPAAVTGRCYAIDRLILTYAPNAKARTASAHIAARKRAAAAYNLFAVDDPQPVHANPLTFSRHEIDAAFAAIPDGRRLSGSEATRENVLAGVDSFSVLHFACHGYADWGDVLNSHLLLADDKRLTLRDVLAGQSAPEKRLAILSACETALPNFELADEVVGIATGFLQAGVGGVIGSMWRISDVSTALLLSQFYKLWTMHRERPDKALREAQRWLRDATNSELRTAFPDIIEQYAPIPESLQKTWGSGRDFADPAYWAAFNYIGS